MKLTDAGALRPCDRQAPSAAAGGARQRGVAAVEGDREASTEGLRGSRCLASCTKMVVASSGTAWKRSSGSLWRPTRETRTRKRRSISFGERAR